jgi:hypothetical protein
VLEGQHADARISEAMGAHDLQDLSHLREGALSPLPGPVLAGSRGGVDPVAAYAGVSHKGLIVLGGRPC